MQVQIFWCHSATIIEADRDYRPTTNLETITSPCVIFKHESLQSGGPPSISIYAHSVSALLPPIPIRLTAPSHWNSQPLWIVSSPFSYSESTRHSPIVPSILSTPYWCINRSSSHLLLFYLLAMHCTRHNLRMSPLSCVCQSRSKAFLGALRTLRWHQFHHHIYRIIRSGTSVPRFLSTHKAYVKAL